ncbi:MAG: baseplate J/gp47 family protein [Alphaproteobacteria bacterium]|nr:baseplate J/gp47 family protein [Alphaproteobacteria bacterium]
MNLSDLEIPQIIEELSLSEVLEQMRNKLIEIDPEFTAYLESDPLIKLMEIAAYRELLLIQRINQAAKANLLAFATESDLDNLAAFYGITRLENETDDELRTRTQAKIVGWSSAGSREAYKFHALNSDPRVKEANADSPEPGLVRISILSKENNGVVSEDLLEAVNDYMQRDDIRMLTDTVQVVPCNLIDIDVRAKITLMSSTPTEFLSTIKSSFKNAFAKIAGLGVSISRSWIISNLFLDGVKDVQLLSPISDVEVSETECARLIDVELSI